MQIHRTAARFKLRSKQDGGWLNNSSKWLSAAVNQAMRDLDYGRFSNTAYARDRVVARRHSDNGDAYGGRRGAS